jgi:hypothetical protein
MKTLQRICAATILSLTLAVSVFAGHIETPSAPAPPPTTNVTTAVVMAIVSLIYG